MLMSGKYRAIDKYLEEKYERKSILFYLFSYQRGFGISKFGFKTLRATSGSFSTKTFKATSGSFFIKTLKAASGSFSIKNLKATVGSFFT